MILARTQNSFEKKELKCEHPDTTRILNPAGYLGMSKSIANLLYNGNVSYFEQVSKLFDVTDATKAEFDNLTVNEIQKMDTVEKLQHIQRLNSCINEALYAGKLARLEAEKVQAEKDKADLEAYRKMQAEKPAQTEKSAT